MPAGFASARSSGWRRRQEWLAIAHGPGVPVAILRLSGIYGPGRNAFVNLANGTARRLVKPGQVFNRIHVDDIAGALAASGEQSRGRHFQRHRRCARAAAGCRHLCRQSDGHRTAARNSLRAAQFRPWRGHSMARTSVSQRRDQATAFRFAIPTIARPSTQCGTKAIGAATAKVMRKPMNALA